LTGDRRLTEKEIELFKQHKINFLEMVSESGDEPSLFEVFFIEVSGKLDAHTQFIIDLGRKIQLLEDKIGGKAVKVWVNLWGDKLQRKIIYFAEELMEKPLPPGDQRLAEIPRKIDEYDYLNGLTIKEALEATRKLPKTHFGNNPTIYRGIIKQLEARI